jgi:transcriptional regulator with XRE-family HTH domain
MAEFPGRPAEARLLLRKRTARKLTPAQAAALAGVSLSTYRQIENGYHIPAKGVVVPKIAPAETLAQMLRGFGGTPRELIDAGRPDAAEILEGILAEEAAAPAVEAAHPEAADARTARARAVAAGILRRFEALPSGIAPDQAGAVLFDDRRLAAAWDAGWTASRADLTERPERVAWAVAVIQVRLEAAEPGSREALAAPQA